jgi:hypothetical protein
VCNCFIGDLKIGVENVCMGENGEYQWEKTWDFHYSILDLGGV